jgi:oxalate decarboxylase/phosphoglucose isomerase-like protein (cupin superfamily)
MPSEDLSEVTHTTMSLAEWFMNHYPEVRASLVSGEGGVRPVECVCEAGEMVFVPRGWWHCVLNLEESVAITQNYCGESGILTAIEYMKERPQCISGTER